MSRTGDKVAISKERVESLMERAGIASVAELAETARINRTHLYRMWTPRTEGATSLELARKLAHALGVSLAELVGDVEPTREATPYDRDSRIRSFADGLDGLSAGDREEILRHALWSIERTARLHRGAMLSSSPNVIRIQFAEDAQPGRVTPRRARVSEGKRMAPRYRAAATPGREVYNTAEDAPEREIPTHYYELGARLVFKAEGDSMKDAHISDADLLFVRPEKDPKRWVGWIVVCSVNGSEYVKILQAMNGKIVLASANDEYKPMVVDEDSDRFEMIGVVVGRSGYTPMGAPPAEVRSPKIRSTSDDGPGLMPDELSRH